MSGISHEGVPFGHSTPSHRVLGWCSHCPNRSMAEELAAWQVNALDQLKDQPCHWYEDEHGGRYFIPGCMARVTNPDIDQCSCKTIEERLADAHKEIISLKRSRASLQNWHDHITRAVYDHPDGIQIMKSAADRAI